MKLEKVKIKNNKSVDMYIVDGFNNEYILFPKEEKTIVVIKNNKKEGKK